MSPTRPSVSRIVDDLRLVATHVAQQPRGYSRQEANMARLVLRRVHLTALSQVLRSVEFVSHAYQPLCADEFNVYAAARRLRPVLRAIERNTVEIQARLRAA